MKKSCNLNVHHIIYLLNQFKFSSQDRKLLTVKRKSMYCLGRCIHNNKPIAIGTWNALWKNLRMEQFARAIGNDSCTQSHHHHHFRCSDHEVSLITLPARNLHRETEQEININMLHLKKKMFVWTVFLHRQKKSKIEIGGSTEQHTQTDALFF